MATFQQLKDVSRLVRKIREADAAVRNALTPAEREDFEEEVKTAENAFAVYLSTLYTGG